ncbi:MarR family transcriptional regulator [Halarchaeum sp. P4]|uniref:DUF7845 domain-containing protein n=1 Tax=Halarchaeum sp. P4 TaxID=3421639 RepID=UPI003EBF4024
MKTVTPGWHEVAGNLNFSGLEGWFALESAFDPSDTTRDFTESGERWRATISYQEGNLLPPDGGETPDGTTVDFETIREWRLTIKRHPDEDPVAEPAVGREGRQRFSAHVRPRWRGQKAEKKNGEVTDIPTPDALGDGLSVRVSGANIDPRRYFPLLRHAVTAFGVNAEHFGGIPGEDGYGPHETSNVQDAARYVRLDKRQSGPVHGRDGPLARMGHLLENDRTGYRKVVQNDDDDYGTNLPGYYHTVTLGPTRVAEAFPGHELAFEAKHYYAREAADRKPSEPLAHPKLEVAYQVSQMPGDFTLRWNDDGITQLQRELDRVIVSILAEAGLDVAPGDDGDEGPKRRGPFFRDSYWKPEVSEAGPDPVSLDFARIRDEQESVVVRHLADGGFSPVEWDIAETLVSDGGKVAPEDIAEENDRPLGSVYRALRRLDDFLERSREKIAFESPFVAEMVVDKVRQAREAGKGALETVAKTAEAQRRGVEETASAFIAWASKYDIDIENRDGARMRLRMSDDLSKDEIQRRIQRGFELWTDAGRDPATFRGALIDFGTGGSSAFYYLQ